jgi:hypothetical protein
LIGRIKYRYYDFTTYGSLTAGGGATTGSRANAKQATDRVGWCGGEILEPALVTLGERSARRRQLAVCISDRHL